ncbi:hypothetical protein WG909_03605 [Peptostreptococcaceae bacterium AGR-M142]
MDVNKGLDELIVISKEKHSLLLKYSKFTNSEKIHIRSSNIELLLNDINNKNDIQKKIDSLDLRFYSILKDLKKELKIDSFEKINPKLYPNVLILQKTIKDIMDILKGIKKEHESNKVDLKKDFEELKSNMKTFNRNKRITGAYKARTSPYSNTHSQISGVFIDNKK